MPGLARIGRSRLTRRAAVGGIAATALVAAIGGVALAQTPPAPPTGGPRASSEAPAQAFLNALAAKLGKSPDEVKAAIVAVQRDRLAQAVKDGKLTQQQADQMAQRLEQSGGLGFPGFGPGVGFPPHGGPGRGPGVGPAPSGGPGRGPLGPGPFGDVATFLGILPTDVASALRSGKSLAQLAQERGKTRDQLKTFLTNQEKQRLDQAVKDGRLTQDQAARRQADLASRLDQMIDRVGPPGSPPGRGRWPAGSPSVRA